MSSSVRLTEVQEGQCSSRNELTDRYTHTHTHTHTNTQTHIVLLRFVLRRFVLRRFVLRRFIFTTLVETDRALPTFRASLSQLKRPFST